MRILATVLSGLAFLISITTTVSLMNAPLYQGIETHCTESGCETIETSQTLVEMNGSGVVYQLIVVILISSLPFLAAFARPAVQRPITWGAALIVLTYSIIGSLSIGLAFMPSAILLLIAGILTLFIRKDITK